MGSFFLGNRSLLDEPSIFGSAQTAMMLSIDVETNPLSSSVQVIDLTKAL